MMFIQTRRFIVLILAGFSLSLGLFMNYSLKLPPIVIIIISIVALLAIIAMYGSDRWQSATGASHFGTEYKYSEQILTYF